MEFDAELDARGLASPLPILCAKKAMDKMTDGLVLRVLATDQKSPKDFVAFCRQTGNDLLVASKEGEDFIFFLRRNTIG
ncbi:MAG: sulfurtransferase TusA family protein [Pseudomonadota bacterium]